MTIIVKCPVCERQLRAPDTAAGKRAKCPKCQAVVELPASPPPPVADEQEFRIAPVDGELSRSRQLPPLGPLAAPRVSTSARTPVVESLRPAAPPQVPWRLALLLAALLPLVYFTFTERPDFEERLVDTIAHHSDKLGDVDFEDLTTEGLMQHLPEGKIEGAHLSYFTWIHWLYAGLSAAGFFGLTFLLFDVGRTQIKHLLISSLTTATFGILLLLVFQWLAEATQGFNLRRGGILMVLFYLMKLIGFSYRAALDPDVGFLASFAGFTFGVGLCEELVKAVPVVARVQNEERGDDWRTASMWGFASGIGFGAAEGIMYSSDYYNGLAGGDIYLVRFVSCVALHAVWSAGVGVAIWRHRESLDHRMDWVEWGLFTLRVIFVSMVLHGLYDTLLKCKYDVWALVVGLASFVWLFGYLEFVRRTNEPEPADA